MHKSLGNALIIKSIEKSFENAIKLVKLGMKDNTPKQKFWKNQTE